jgi:hypothetical protein
MTPAQTAVVTSRTIQGIPIRAIAQEIGTSHQTVLRTQHKPEIKALIEREAAEIINRGLKPARRTITRLAAMGNAKGADKDMLKLSLDASKHITSMAGLSGTTPSTIINALIQVNQHPARAQELDCISAFLQSQWQPNQPIQSNDGETKRIGIATPHTPVCSPDVIDIDAQDVQPHAHAPVDNCQLST